MRTFVFIFLTLCCICPSFSNTEVMLGNTDEKIIGQTVPNVDLRDEGDQKVSLFAIKQEGSFILVPVFTHCKFACSLNVSHLKDVARDLKKINYTVIIFSFDPKDGGSDLKKFRKNLDIPKKWLLYSADAKNLQVLLDSLDFRFMSQGEDFIHPNVIYILSPKLKITKYLTGVSYTSNDLDAAIQDSPEVSWIAKMFRIFSPKTKLIN